MKVTADTITDPQILDFLRFGTDDESALALRARRFPKLGDKPRKANEIDADREGARAALAEAYNASHHVCGVCCDTHLMTLGDRDVMCTRCPIPCRECARGGNGAYCATPACLCRCHAKDVIVAREGSWIGVQP